MNKPATLTRRITAQLSVLLLGALPLSTLAADELRMVAPCGFMPNCVSTAHKADSFHYVAPIKVPTGEQKPVERLKKVVLAMPGAKLVSESADYLKLEYTTDLMKFTDDVEFAYNKNLDEFEVRSASRLGISDFGVNRKRVEAVRKAFSEPVSAVTK